MPILTIINLQRRKLQWMHPAEATVDAPAEAASESK